MNESDWERNWMNEISKKTHQKKLNQHNKRIKSKKSKNQINEYQSEIDAYFFFACLHFVCASFYLNWRECQTIIFKYASTVRTVLLSLCVVGNAYENGMFQHIFFSSFDDRSNAEWKKKIDMNDSLARWWWWWWTKSPKNPNEWLIHMDGG